MATVTWTQDVSGNYEVSSPEHLKQIMHQGTLYTDTGSPPANYWETGTNYKQVADIDLSGNSADITPIGTLFNGFKGVYDGGEFKILNWSYIDPEFGTENDCVWYVGLFGHGVNSTLKNIRLAGVFTLQGYRSSCGFLVGVMDDDGTQPRGIFNVECDFSTGTFIDNDRFCPTMGAIVGKGDCSIMEGLTLKGSVNLATSFLNTRVGGLIGEGNVNTRASLLRNLASFPSGIPGRNVGGVIGEWSPNSGATLSKCINAMTGDILGDNTAGGIVGIGLTNKSTGGEESDSLLNAMTGNITYTGSDTTGDAVGGIFGYLNTDSSVTKLFNYMTGDISAAPDGSGGLFGWYSDGESTVFSMNLINAMNGNVTDAIIGNRQVRSGSLNRIQADTRFGLTFSTDNFSTPSDTPQSGAYGLLTTPDFPDLLYFDINGSDEIGNIYDFDFVYANISGSSSYSNTHVIIPNGETIFQDGAILIPLLSVEPRPVNIPIVITEVSGATGYNITYEGPTGGEVTALSGVTTLEHNITGVEPETEYTIRMYADTGTGYDLTDELTTITPPNIAANYDITDFQVGGVTDLTSLDATTLSNMSSVLTGLVDTGDIVSVSLPSNPNLNTSFVDVGGTLSIANVDGVLLPFEGSSGTGQTVSLTLSDNATIPVVYDEVSNTVSVESTAYIAGDSFVLDGNGIEVLDYYGLTILSIGEIPPLTVEPRSINIPVVITEVPGATSYQVTYEGPTGGEITALSGLTTFEHNIIGLDPDTAYTIRLYADTGAGYVLIQQLTSATLANVATSYDKQDFEDGGFYNLLSMSSNSLSTLSKVWDGVFGTGDVVGVPMLTASEFKGSFINIGDTLSIKEISGVVLPFETSSGTGQDVNVTLSDDATTIPITYDEAANTITVNGVVYYPGDKFVLDGKKVTVVDV